MRRFPLALLAASAALSAPSAASAATTPLAGCPSTTPGVNVCFKAVTTGGSLSINGQVTPIVKPLTITGGFTASTGWADIVGAKAVGEPQNVPGGISGVPGSEFALPGVTDIKSYTELAGTPRINLARFVAGQTALELPIKIRLANNLFGTTCYIGSDANPIRLLLTARSLGTPSLLADGSLLTRGAKLVDRTFSVPVAQNCAGVTAIINSKQGLPAASGKNQALFVSTSQLQPIGRIKLF